jgi:hypothetical protein
LLPSLAQTPNALTLPINGSLSLPGSGGNQKTPVSISGILLILLILSMFSFFWPGEGAARGGFSWCSE